MPDNANLDPRRWRWLREDPLPSLLVGLAAGVMGAAIARLWPGCPGPIRAGLVVGSLLAAGAAVSLRPKSWAVVGVAAVVGWLAWFGTDPAWDSARLLVAILTGIAGSAAFLLSLSPGLGLLSVVLWGRAQASQTELRELQQRGERVGQVLSRTAVSLFIVFHFCGILTAINNVPLPNGQPAWVANQLWTRVYRPYLTFFYLNNAYHFYSPEPGPACLLWYYIEYSDGSARWVKVPNRQEHAKDPLAMEYYRRLSIAENANQLMPVGVPADGRPRRIKGEQMGIPSPEEITLHMSWVPQYRMPAENTKRITESYIRHVARTNPPPPRRAGQGEFLAILATAPADGLAGFSWAGLFQLRPVEIVGIKFYRVMHMMLQPSQFGQGEDPLDPVLFLPYYHGEFDRHGQLKDPHDPLLYWLIPILRKTSDPSAGKSKDVVDYLEVHARGRAANGE